MVASGDVDAHNWYIVILKVRLIFQMGRKNFLALCCLMDNGWGSKKRFIKNLVANSLKVLLRKWFVYTISSTDVLKLPQDTQEMCVLKLPDLHVYFSWAS